MRTRVGLVHLIVVLSLVGLWLAGIGTANAQDSLTIRGPITALRLDGEYWRHIRVYCQRRIGAHHRSINIRHSHGIIAGLIWLDVVERQNGLRGPGERLAIELPLVNKRRSVTANARNVDSTVACSPRARSLTLITGTSTA